MMMMMMMMVIGYEWDDNDNSDQDGEDDDDDGDEPVKLLPSCVFDFVQELLDWLVLVPATNDHDFVEDL